MKKNDLVRGVCTSYTYDAHGVVKINGFPLFVKGLLLEEDADIIVTMVKKSFGYGKISKLHITNDQRSIPKCPIANTCGGCQLQHMSFAHQCAFKKQQVEEVIRRVGKLDTPVEDVLTMNDPYHYRNKAQIPVGIVNDQIVTGFYRINSKDIVDMQHCYIQSERINEVFLHMRTLLHKYQNATSFRHLLIKHARQSDEIMLVWIVQDKKIPYLDEMISYMTSQVVQIKSILLNINKRNDNVILGEEEVLVYGEPYITDSIHGLKFRISAKSFYQVNPIQTEVLYGTALSFCELSKQERVLDLYCGVGTISMFLAQQAKHVIGIEIIPEAIEDAKINAKLNGITNIDFICSDALSYATKLAANKESIDVIVVDPPRKGCDEETLKSMIEIAPKRIVYVSCKASTLARDLRILEDHGYHTKKIQPVDMFCMTYGIECVVQLERL